MRPVEFLHPGIDTMFLRGRDGRALILSHWHNDTPEGFNFAWGKSPWKYGRAYRELDVRMAYAANALRRMCEVTPQVSSPVALIDPDTGDTGFYWEACE